MPGAPKGACGVARLARPTRLGRRAGPWAVVAHEGLPKPPPARNPTTANERDFSSNAGRCHTGAKVTTKHPTAVLGRPKPA